MNVLPIICRVVRGTAFCVVLSCSLFAQQTYRIAGVVVDSRTNAPLPRTDVIISLIPSTEPGVRVVTGSDGHFAFERLAAGKYSLAAVRRGYSLQPFDAHEDYATAIVTGPGQDSEHLVFKLHAQASITGRVLDDFDEPVRGARVVLIGTGVHDGDPNPSLAGEASTDDQGSFLFSTVEAGHFLLAVTAHPWYSVPSQGASRGMVVGPTDPRPPDPPRNPELDVTYPLTYFPGTPDADAAETITLLPGGEATADVHLHAVPNLTIHLNAPAGVRIGGAQLSRKMSGIDFWGVEGVSGSGDQSGNYTLYGVAPGSYKLRVDYPQTAWTEKSDPNTTYWHRPRSWIKDINVVGDTEIDTIDVPDVVTVTGTVAVEGAALPRVVLNFLGTQNGAIVPVEYITNNGKPFLIDLPVGDYRVGTQETPGYFVSSVTASRVLWSGGILHLTAGDAVKLRVVVTNGVGTVDGFAMDGDRGRSGVMVLLLPKDTDNAELIRRDQSDSDGSFTLPNVIPGSYSLLALRDGWNLKWRDHAVLKAFLAKAVPVTISRDTKLNLKVPVQ